VHIEAHNVFLARAAELGVPGLLLWAVLVLMGPLRLLVARIHSAVGVYVVAGGSAAAWFVALMAAPLSQRLPNYLVWLLAGVALAQSDSRRLSVTVE
jgi:putative inorganic carbon (hco3(-)) transporter